MAERKTIRDTTPHLPALFQRSAPHLPEEAVDTPAVGDPPAKDVRFRQQVYLLQRHLEFIDQRRTAYRTQTHQRLEISQVVQDALDYYAAQRPWEHKQPNPGGRA